MDPGARTLAWGQGLYWAAAGAWPLVHMPSFEAVTGPKRERWLVRTVGVLVLAIGGALALAARRRRVTPELRLLAAGSAAGLGAIDTWYAARRRISPIYLGDAALEAALVAGWIISGRPRRAGEEGER
ncbi:MAG TPA: hypothetical protein VF912_09860 [Anaeromyxobacter sp.]